jgi:hypothetical protein
MPETISPETNRRITPFDAGPLPIGYATTALPERAQANLRIHARPLGDTSEWPLSELQLNQLCQTMTIRKTVAAAAALYKLLVLLAVIGFTFVATIIVRDFLRGHLNGPRTALLTLVCVGIGAFYTYVEVSTRRSQKWAPLTMACLFCLGGLGQVLAIIAMASQTYPQRAAGGIAVTAVALVFDVAFAWLSFRAFFAIPKYLSMPAWCQEFVVKAGL